MNLKDFQKIFNPVLTDIVEQKLQLSYKTIDSLKLQKILNYIRDFVLWWGKRIRPYLIYISYKWFGWQDDNEILKLASGFELWHAFALIHDDIMDQWETRRNIKTYHKYIQSITKNSKSQHYAISQAILMWDLIFSWANEIIFDDYNSLNNQKLNEIRKDYLEMSRETIFGQIIDVSLTITSKVKKQDLDKKNYLKTSKYSFIKPMMVWSQLWWISSSDLLLIQKWGEYLWSAFQIRDDLKDVLEDSKKTWKTAFSDVREWQQTVLTYYISQKGTAKQKEFLDSCMWNDLTTKQISKLKQIFQDSWAIDYGFSQIKKNLDQAKIVLFQINFKNISAKNDLEEIIDLIGK